mmetsp:Transcript_16715/g.28511  ORF Transcript_16715/g.28511 Transcript_16715/m.28511 type:complete len:135 (+) Transcript_16715:140-544(+)
MEPEEVAVEFVETRRCRNCLQIGHIAKACAQPKRPDTRDCRICGEVGHIARNCPSKAPSENETQLASGGGGGGGCSENGGGKKKSNRKGGLDSKRCFNCGQNGHLSEDCVVPVGNTACYICKQEGHKSSDCPSK